MEKAPISAIADALAFVRPEYDPDPEGRWAGWNTAVNAVAAALHHTYPGFGKEHFLNACQT